jgi:hypothetical protein
VQISLAELGAQTGSPAEAEPLASAAAAEFAKNNDVDEQSSALSALLHAQVAQDKRSEADATWKTLESLHSTDQDVQFEVEMAEARYRAMTGIFDLALERVGHARDFCKQHGRVNCELDARLLTDQIRLQAGMTDGLDAELKSLAQDASDLGFVLIASESAKTTAALAARLAQQ